MRLNLRHVHESAVAIMGFALAGFRTVRHFRRELPYLTMGYGWNTSLLPSGQNVRIIQEVRSGESSIPEGASGVVVSDPAIDEDDARPDRLVRLRFGGGAGKRIEIGVKRASLRAN